MNVREIKFRIWNTTYCKMSETFTLEQFAYDQDGEMGDCQLNLNDGIGENRKENILMQFTSLHDKNGREIYEGDIFRSDLTGEPKIIVFHEGGFTVTNKNRFGSASNDYLRSFHNEIEIIGNIYENPEALKEGGGK